MLEVEEFEQAADEARRSCFGDQDPDGRRFSCTIMDEEDSGLHVFRSRITSVGVFKSDTGAPVVNFTCAGSPFGYDGPVWFQWKEGSKFDLIAFDRSVLGSQLHHAAIAFVTFES